MKLVTYDDLTGDGTKYQLITLLKIGGVAVVHPFQWGTKWFQATMLTSSGVSRIGDENVSATNGVPVGTNNNGQFIPPIAFATDVYDLSNVWVLINSGDVMSVARAI